MFTQTHTTTARRFRTRGRATALHRRTTDVAAPAATPLERLRADLALVVLWAALAVAVLAAAIVHGSIGALLVAGVVIWLLRVAWGVAVQTRAGDDHEPIRFD